VNYFIPIEKIPASSLKSIMQIHTIPPLNHPEWRKLVHGEIQYTFKSFVFQLTVDDVKKKLAAGTLTESEAVERLHALCQKYKLATYKDIQILFNL
jgi:hypothetical protein